MKQILITGGSGQLGGYIIPLLKGKYGITVFDFEEPSQEVDRFIRGDIVNLDECKGACQGIDIVMHLAAIPVPFNDPPERVFHVNVMGTFNVLEAACGCGVKKVVFASSDGVLGFVFQERKIAPEYVPIDEAHPLRPQDSYGLSKLAGEEICRAYTGRYGIETICLRPGFIRYPERAGEYDYLADDPSEWWKGLWVHTDARDAAQAFYLAAEVEGIGHDAFFICADINGTREKTSDLIKKYYPETKEISSSLEPYGSVITCAKAKKVLGYKPKYSWKDLHLGQRRCYVPE